jgi:hypothetical protein
MQNKEKNFIIYNSTLTSYVNPTREDIFWNPNYDIREY